MLRRASGDRREIATTLLGMGTLALYAGDESGRRLIEQAVQIFDRTEDGPGQQLTPLNLAAYELDRGDPRRACELLERVAIADDDVLMGAAAAGRRPSWPRPRSRSTTQAARRARWPWR